MDHIAVAKGKHIKISSRKGKLVADLVRNKDVGEAVTILKYSPKRGAQIVLKVLNSAVANVQVKHPNIDIDDLFISEIYLNQAQYQKRFKPRARGRATRILKKYSHLTIYLREREE